MKTLKVKSILFSLLAVMAVAVFLTSCEQESIVEEEIEGLLVSEQENNNIATESPFDKELEMWLTMAEEANVIVEHATLSEINRVMIEHGLEPFKESDLNQAIQLKSNMPCHAFVCYGDFNNDGKLSSADLVGARQYLCNISSVGCNTNVITQGFGRPIEVQRFGWLSYLINGSEAVIFNSRDIDIATDFILGLIACN